MKTAILSSLLMLFATSTADAGDFRFDFGIKKDRRGRRGFHFDVRYKDRDHCRHCRRKHRDCRCERRRHRRHRRVGRHGPVARHHCERCWVPGRYERVKRRVHVPGYCERVWVPPVYEYRCDRRGRRIRVCVRQGYWKEVWHPARYEYRWERVHVPGHWEYRCNTPGHDHGRRGRHRRHRA